VVVYAYLPTYPLLLLFTGLWNVLFPLFMQGGRIRWTREQNQEVVLLLEEKMKKTRKKKHDES